METVLKNRWMLGIGGTVVVVGGGLVLNHALSSTNAESEPELLAAGAMSEDEKEDDPTPAPDHKRDPPLAMEQTIDAEAVEVARRHSIPWQMLLRVEQYAQFAPHAWKGLVESLASLLSFEETVWKDETAIRRGDLVPQAKYISALNRALRDIRRAVLHGPGRRQMLEGVAMAKPSTKHFQPKPMGNKRMDTANKVSMRALPREQPSIIAEMEDALGDMERFGLEKQKNLRHEADLQTAYRSREKIRV